jgi:hypothetical protein
MAIANANIVSNVFLISQYLPISLCVAANHVSRRSPDAPARARQRGAEPRYGQMNGR